MPGKEECTQALFSLASGRRVVIEVAHRRLLKHLCLSSFPYVSPSFAGNLRDDLHRPDIALLRLRFVTLFALSLHGRTVGPARTPMPILTS